MFTSFIVCMPNLVLFINIMICNSDTFYTEQEFEVLNFLFVMIGSLTKYGFMGAYFRVKISLPNKRSQNKIVINEIYGIKVDYKRNCCCRGLILKHEKRLRINFYSVSLNSLTR